jgi:uncharacterized protein (TIGR03437 family)
MVWSRLRAVLPALAVGLLAAQTPSGVGDGSPNPAVLAWFLQAFARGDFSTRVALPPVDSVHRLGPGYVQNFKDIDAAEGFGFLLAQPDSTPGMAFQMCCQLLAFHASIGGFAGKVGYPVTDYFPGLASAVDNSASLQQNFESGYVLILHQGGAFAGKTFFIAPPNASIWQATPALGLPVSGPLTTASRFSTTATEQDFQGGVIVQITSGPRSGQTYTVSGSIYKTYAAIGGTTGSFLGYPVGSEITVSGKQRQNFEGGYIDYVAGSDQPAAAHAPVLSVSLDTTPLSLQVGNTVQRTLLIFDTTSTPVTGRQVTWTTSNRSVVQIDANGPTATLRAVGPGFADIVAFVDGVSSGTLRITVTSACCLVGEGAPDASVRQAFQDALQRNGIAPRLPAGSPVQRLGAGYVQEFTALTPANLGRLLVMKADNAAQAFVVSADRLARYLQTGGPAGPLGFAVSDATAAGRQLFQNNFALAGSPAVLVAPPISNKWAAMGYEAGAAGSPVSDAAPAGPSPFGSAGVSQAFTNGVIYGFTPPARSSQPYFVTGPILARYNQLNGPAGMLGLPASDAFLSASGRIQQNFEGGSIDFAPGDSGAVEHSAARTPAVAVWPGQVAIGGRVRAAISGFTPGRTLTVSVTSRPDFTVTPPDGTYWWDIQIAPGTAPGPYTITARDAAGGARASGSYTVRPAAQVAYRLAKVSGDGQTALPGSQAALPLVVQMTDESGNPIAGAPVSFGSFAGAVVSPAAAVTDSNGCAQAALRLPPSNGLVLANAASGKQVVTFSARAQDGRLSGFPSFKQGIDSVNVGGGPATIHQKGSLLAALAALFRYYQDQGILPAPSGLADPAALNQFLLADGYLTFTLNGRPEQVVNPVRALDFVSAATDLEPLSTDPAAIRDSLNARRPVLLGLMLRAGNQNAGAHYVVATGVGPDGSIGIYDPSPDWNRATLSDYLNGFSALGRNWTAALLHALRLTLTPRPARGFLSYAPGSAQLRISANAGSGYQLSIPALAAFDQAAADNGDTADLWYRDGAASQYQLSAAAGVNVRGPALIGPIGPGVFRINPDPAAFSVAPETLTVAADGLRSAADFGAGLAPGSLASLFGAGLADARAVPGQSLPDTLGGLAVTVDGRPAPLLFASPFQANLQLPYGLAAGPHTVAVASKFGSAAFNISLEEAAPGIFLVAPNTGAVLNQDGGWNSVLNPAPRGSVLQVFAAGLGEVAPPVPAGVLAPASPLSLASAKVTATLDGQPAPVQFAGLAPGFAGLYQVNIQIPPGLAPSSHAQLIISAAGRASNAVDVAIQ